MPIGDGDRSPCLVTSRMDEHKRPVPIYTHTPHAFFSTHTKILSIFISNKIQTNYNKRANLPYIANARVFFDDSGKRQACVLHGLGGAQNTHIRLNFIKICQDAIVPRLVSLTDGYLHVRFWTYPSQVLEYLFHWCYHSQNDRNRSQGYLLTKGMGEETLDWLAGQREEWLLLLNNADDTTFNPRKSFPSCSHGNISITTWNRDIVQNASDMRSSFLFSAMGSNHATNLFLKISRLPEQHTKDTEALATVIVKVWCFSHLKYQCNDYYSGAREYCTPCGTDQHIYISIRMGSLSISWNVSWTLWYAFEGIWWQCTEDQQL